MDCENEGRGNNFLRFLRIEKKIKARKVYE